jgi:actin-related protein
MGFKPMAELLVSATTIEEGIEINIDELLLLATFLAMYHYRKDQEEKATLSSLDVSPCQVIVDSGYSFTYVVPYFDNQPINYAIKR